MKNKRTVKLHLYIDRKGSFRVNKTKYALRDGEIRVGLTLYVPEQFYKPAALEAETSITLKQDDLPPLETTITTP